jgi:hypothetical protein
MSESNETLKPISASVPDNPLDTLFGITPEIDLNVEQKENYVQVNAADFAVISADPGADQDQEPDPDAKSAEDAEIDQKIDDVHKAAIEAFNTQTAYMELIEPRYAARNAEVAAQYLNIALNAANSRARVKADRAKTKAFVPYANAQNKLGGQTVTASREEIMAMLERGNS